MSTSWACTSVLLGLNHNILIRKLQSSTTLNYSYFLPLTHTCTHTKYPYIKWISIVHLLIRWRTTSTKRWHHHLLHTEINKKSFGMKCLEQVNANSEDDLRAMQFYHLSNWMKTKKKKNEDDSGEKRSGRMSVKLHIRIEK